MRTEQICLRKPTIYAEERRRLSNSKSEVNTDAENVVL